MNTETSITLTLDSRDEALLLFGSRDQHLRLVREALGIRLVARGDLVHIEGAADQVDRAERVFQQLRQILHKKGALTPDEVRTVLDVVQQGEDREGAQALAAAALSRREVNRIILTRPAVEAGERLGFLPGDLMAKVDPYLRPLFDALHDMLEPDRVSQHLERGVIEVAPLAFMRGRTLNDSFVILDEAQNTTPEQMKMFLTRIGFGSRAVVTGDVTQTDLPSSRVSGLRARARAGSQSRSPCRRCKRSRCSGSFSLAPPSRPASVSASSPAT